MKKILIGIIAGLSLCFLVIFGIDAEVARIDRVENGTAVGCVFATNCH